MENAKIVPISSIEIRSHWIVVCKYPPPLWSILHETWHSLYYIYSIVLLHIIGRE